MAKGKGGFIGQDGLNAPDGPTGVSGSAGDEQVDVSFTAPSDVGGSAITGYRVQSNNALSFSGSYANKSFNVSSQAGAAGGVQFKSDGTKMYVTGQTSDKTFQYSLSTAYDVSTASYDSVELNHATQVSNANPYDLFFKTDGTKLYVIFGINDTVYQYSLSSAWDLSTASYDSVNFSVASQESGEPQGLAFSDDGTKMYVCGEGQATVFQYTLSTAWDLSSASYSSKSLDVSAQGTKPSGLAFALSGKVMLVSEESAVSVDVYYLGTPFDVTTASYNYSFDVSSQDPRPWYVALADSDTKMYVGGPNNDTVYQYTVSFSEESTYGASGSSSPITVTGLTNGTSYTFSVWAINAFGYSAPSDASGSVSPFNPLAGEVGLFSGFYNTDIHYIVMTTTGNSVDFGDMPHVSEVMGALGSSTRGIFFGNVKSAATANSISYVTFSSAGNATDFGDKTVATQDPAGASNSTRGLMAGGDLPHPQGRTNVIDYITIASTGNATDFGDLTVGREQLDGNANSTRALFAGGTNVSGYLSNVIDYVTIASTGNATDFGDTSTTGGGRAGASSSTRALHAGGTNASYASVNEIQYNTIASTGNTSDFGDLTVARTLLGGVAGSTRGVFAGGDFNKNTIDYVVIGTLGNATDFGDLTTSTGNKNPEGCSNSHGGLS